LHSFCKLIWYNICLLCFKITNKQTSVVKKDSKNIKDTKLESSKSKNLPPVETGKEKSSIPKRKSIKSNRYIITSSEDEEPKNKVPKNKTTDKATNKTKNFETPEHKTESSTKSSTSSVSKVMSTKVYEEYMMKESSLPVNIK